MPYFTLLCPTLPYFALLYPTLPYIALPCPTFPYFTLIYPTCHTLPYTGHTCLPLFTLIHLFLHVCSSGAVHLVLFIWCCSSGVCLSGDVHLVLFIWSCSSGPVHLVIHQLARRRTVGNVTVILPRVTHVQLDPGTTLGLVKVSIA